MIYWMNIHGSPPTHSLMKLCCISAVGKLKNLERNYMGKVRKLLKGEQQQNRWTQSMKGEMEKSPKAGLPDLKGSSDRGKTRDGAAAFWGWEE